MTKKVPPGGQKMNFSKNRLREDDQRAMPIGKMVSLLILPFGNPKSARGRHPYVRILFPFYGKFVIIYQRRIPPKKFWILKFFGLRQNLTRQLQAQIKKGCSKFWICHTFKNFLNCGTNSTFKKRWADNVLIFFFHFTLDPFLTWKFWNFGILFSSKFLLIDSPLMTPATIFSHMKFWILKKNPDSSNFWRSPKNF